MTAPKHTFTRLILGAAALLVAMPSMARADVYVIVNSSLTLVANDIRLIYTGDKQFLGTQKIKPVDNHSAQSEFLGTVLALNPGRYDSLWVMKSFRDGLVAPGLKATDADVIAYVQATPGAIGYVTTAPPPGTVVLKKF
jgi:hypothetical protein